MFMHEWPHRDRELAKSLILSRRGGCPGCGHPKAEVWVDPDEAEFDYIAEEIQCITCARLQSERDGEKTQKGLHYYIERRPKGSGKPLPDPDDQGDHADDR